jgi:hypothetical protein
MRVICPRENGAPALSPYNYVFHPDRFFVAVWQNPPAGHALLVLLFVSCLSGAVLAVGRRRAHGFRSPSVDRTGENFLGPACIVFFTTALLTFLDFGLLRAFRIGVRFDWLICLAVYAALPVWIVWLPYAGLQTSWLVYRLIKALCLIMAAWSIALFWCCIRVEPSYGVWQATVIAFPFVTAIIALCVLTLRDRPDVLRACLPWRRKKGKRVDLFYPAGGFGSGPDETVAALDSALDRVAAALDLGPLDFRLPVYVFPDAERLHASVGTRDSLAAAGGFSHNDAVSLASCDLHTLCARAAHEFAHVYRYQFVTRELSGLLDEGLACYVEHSLFGTYLDHGPLPVSWRTMARYTVFYEWQYTSRAEYDSHQSYAYAYSVAAYLIQAYGLEKYLELCGTVVADQEHLAGEMLADAIQEVYGVSIEELEAGWRRLFVDAQADPGESAGAELKGKIAELEARVRELEERLAGQTALDLEEAADLASD